MSARKPVAVAFQKPQPLLSRQPLSTLWTVLSLARLCATLPVLLVYYQVPSNRGSPKRTVTQEIAVQVFKAICTWMLDTRIDLGRAMKPAKSWEDQFMLFQPPADSYFQDLVKDDYIKPEPVPAVWYPRRPEAADLTNKRFLIHFHGGAYVSGGYDPSISAKGGILVAEKTSSFILMVGYRKAIIPGYHFPTQIQDAITAYAGIVKLGVPSSKIVVSGDSAGGHLALNLLRYVLEHPDIGLPKPAALTIDSPWTDVLSDSAAKFSSRPNCKKDIVDFDFVMWARSAFLSPTIPLTNPYVSPLHNPFSLQGVPAWVETGLDETINEETCEFVRVMSEVKGNMVELYRAPDGVHCPLWAGPTLGFAETAEGSCKSLRSFLDTYVV